MYILARDKLLEIELDEGKLEITHKAYVSPRTELDERQTKLLFELMKLHFKDLDEEF